jgi:hypothetical protein
VKTNQNASLEVHSEFVLEIPLQKSVEQLAAWTTQVLQEVREELSL